MTLAHSIRRPRYRLLVAEDDKALREMIVALFRADGYDVVPVTNGVELLDVLQVSLDLESDVREFDFVISDVRMPGTSGPRALARIGDRQRVPPVVFMTAFGDEEVHEEAMRVGAVAVLDKPVDLDELRAFVGTYLTQRSN
jgi:CheY-like chemotaxis protein